MPTDYISFRDTNYFSSLICDYLDQSVKLKRFVNRFPKIENFKSQIIEKQSKFDKSSRAVLVNALKGQYQNLDTSELTCGHIDLLLRENTFTVTTGHQLNLFTGPLYFFYKIISTINLAKELKAKYSDYNFIPMYWMASEDHDFDEINYFNFNGKKVQWSKKSGGAVGRLNTEGLDAVFDTFKSNLGFGDNTNYIKKLFTETYVNHNSLAEATLFLANELFKNYGLVIIDADNHGLKTLFTPFLKNEILEQWSRTKVSETNKKLVTLGYKIQVNPREINLFYLKDGLRSRILKQDNQYVINNTSLSFTQSEILEEIDNYPERFSPNVIMRPLYQEVILPNLCYIGGGGELAYWFQLKSFFEKAHVTFPILLLRNSVVIYTKKHSEKMAKLDITIKKLFTKRDDLIKTQILKFSDIDIDFTIQKKHLREQFKFLFELANQTDKSFIGAVAAQEKKQLKGLNNLERRLMKAQKRKLSNQISQVVAIQNELFPEQSLQERYLNFSELYIEFGNRLIEELIKNLEPLNNKFLILDL